ncbi:DUF4959 domain-containing protein [Wenyingzhuangia sp. chi5]|uniref:DUF4959 domain-containing protein n=1 Tax=Wenyingzhuangia gilva TaxID=3057677 RepID=A0ABT8VR48_9FLAO|nr:DUF4959 domain-containing protein [Wenyingzhuangia sp. chi5]MDO3694439.1 DUF4959 domain-containing protein [Wenyingzhuangia sp. chi5]
MNNKIFKTSSRIYTVLCIFLALVSCREDEVGPLENNPNTPGKIENVNILNIAGGAELTYTLPSDQDLLYVKAVYTLSSGKVAEVKSSYYQNKLVIEGFADMDEHDVKLYAVNRSEKVSEPTTVTIQPLESPIWEVFRTLEATTAFGGVRLTAKNELRTDLSLLLMEKDEYGDWITNINSIYTSTDSINKTIRGFEIEEHNFAITVRDRWLNTTDTLFTSITPYPEVALPKSKYKPFVLPNDTKTHATAVLSRMWDGETFNWPGVFLTDGSVPGQHLATFDIGELTQLSRIVIWDYPEYYNDRSYYYIGNLKEFEIWGSANPNPDGSLDNTWYRLGSYNAVKPSGLPFGEQTGEDFETARAGFSWEFDVAAPKVRYLRIKSIKNWGGIGSMSIAEVQVYGAPNE